MGEIGGYMEFETYYGEEFHANLISLNTVRNSIRYILKNKGYTKVYLPYYLCDCIVELLQKINIEHEFYAVNDFWLPAFDKKLNENECIFIVNYYGQLTNQIIAELKEKYLNVLLDNTQSFFQTPVSNVDTFYNCRKYFGVPDGSYLYTNIFFNETIPTDISYDRFTYLIGRYERSPGEFYQEFTSCDDSLKYKELMYMSKITKNIMKSLDYPKIKAIRRENFSYLHDNLSSLNQLQNLKTGTFMYPFMCSNAQRLRNKLIENEIFIPILWPNVLDSKDTLSYDYQLARTILPIPIDQRYGIKEMKFIIDAIKVNNND